MKSAATNGYPTSPKRVGASQVLPPDSELGVSQGAVLSPVHLGPKKSLVEAYALGLALGFLGAHHFYLRRTWYGVAYLFTFGLLGAGYAIDLFRMPWLVSEANKRRECTNKNEKNLCDAYVLWFPCGLFGFHHFYLRNPGLGLLYFFTLGLFGIGFLVDAFRMPFLVKEANERTPTPAGRKSLCAAYICGASPLGILGAHHYYLNRPLWGVLYTFTGGLLFVGWVYDWFRMPFLVKRANEIQEGKEDPRMRHIDDIYILWFPPWGFLGLHHFYSNRTGWGVLYFFTFGLLGIGWLVDFCRLPFLVEDCNKEMTEQGVVLRKTVTYLHAGVACPSVTVTVSSVVGTSVMTHPTGNVLTAPPGAAMTAPPGEHMPPPYSYQNQSAYPAQAYPSAGMAYSPQPFYTNPGFDVTSAGNYGVPVQPPSYEESLSTPVKSAPPIDNEKH